MIDVTVRDETLSGDVIESWVLPGLPDTITAGELLRLRVREEGARFDGFVMIAGDRQVEDLDERLDLARARTVAFIRLVPLGGG